MLITFEGIDGCGKSTQISHLVSYLKNKGLNVHLFREPGGTPLSEQIRDILLNSNETIHPVTETLLFSAARSQLIHQTILPLLEKNEIVILDRFFDSTTAYQGYGRQVLDIDKINVLNQLATNGIVPDITFYLKVPLETALQRRRQEREDDRMERSGNDFFERVIKGFDKIAAGENRIISIDSTGNPEATFQTIIKAVKESGLVS